MISRQNYRADVSCDTFFFSLSETFFFFRLLLSPGDPAIATLLIWFFCSHEPSLSDGELRCLVDQRTLFGMYTLTTDQPRRHLRLARAGSAASPARWAEQHRCRLAVPGESASKEGEPAGGPFWSVDCYLNGRNRGRIFPAARHIRKTRIDLQRRAQACFEHPVVVVDAFVWSLSLPYVRASALLDGHRLSSTRTA